MGRPAGKCLFQYGRGSNRSPSSTGSHPISVQSRYLASLSSVASTASPIRRVETGARPASATSPVLIPSFNTEAAAFLSKIGLGAAVERIAQHHGDAEQHGQRIGDAAARRYRAPSRARARKRAGRPPSLRTAPSEAEGSMPSELVSIDASSDSMSSNRLSVTMTSNWSGLRAAAASRNCRQYMWLSATSWYSAAWIAVTSSRHSRPDSMTLAFSTEQTLGSDGCGQARMRRARRGESRRSYRPALISAPLAVADIGDAPGFAEIDAAGQFAHDHDVQAPHNLGFETSDASSRASNTMAGRILANSSSSLRIASNPASGRILKSILSHLGPPTAPSRTASDALAKAMVLADSGCPPRRRWRSRRPGLLRFRRRSRDACPASRAGGAPLP